MLRIWPPARSTLERQPVDLAVGSSAWPSPRWARPQRAPGGGVGKREFEDRVEPPDEGRVEAVAAVGGEDRDAVEILDPLQQIVGLGVGEAVVGVADLGARAEQRIRLVEEQHDVGMLGGVEQGREVLLGLADPLAGHARRGRPGRAAARPAAASQCAASVLPVPDSPVNSAPHAGPVAGARATGRARSASRLRKPDPVEQQVERPGERRSG